MKPEHKKAWIDALRSGEYKQGKGVLYNKKDNTYCCLGVLYEVTEGLRITKDLNGPFDNINTEGYIPLFPLVDTEIWRLNDIDKLTFNHIADILEAEN